MNMEPRLREEYNDRQTEAAHRVLIDVGQILSSFVDCLVLVGGWVPDLLIPAAEEKHVGSIDVDLALDAARLNEEGRYAELLGLLIATGRYTQGSKPFQLIVQVDLKDGGSPIQVDLDFLASADVKLKKNTPKLLEGFRILKTESCSTAFHAPEEQTLSGLNVRGAENTVRLQVASLADFLIMKSHAIAGREKPKDSYDLCYCLQYTPEGREKLAAAWSQRKDEKNVSKAIQILQEKFSSPRSFGPQQIVEFHNSSHTEEQEQQARLAYELVREFLEIIDMLIVYNV